MNTGQIEKGIRGGTISDWEHWEPSFSLKMNCELGQCLDSHIVSIHQKSNPFRATMLDESMAKIHRSERFPAPGRHLNQRTRLVLSK